MAPRCEDIPLFTNRPNANQKTALDDASAAILNQEVTTKELAVVLDLSPGRIRQLVQEGVLDRDAPNGKFTLQHAVGCYVTHLLMSGVRDRK
jgi:hypothetical protein